jgi:serine/threonine protein phosphatase PrpC
MDGDIIVIASDGLWDNLFDVKIIDIIRPFLRETDKLVEPNIVAEMIA